MNLTALISITAAVVGFSAALASILLFIRLRWPAPVLWFLKLYVSALSLVLGFIGAVVAIIGLITASGFLTLIGAYDVMIYLTYAYRVSRSPDFSGSFENAFGVHWENHLTAEQKINFLSSRMQWRLPTLPEPRVDRNIAFATIPDTGRKLLCDVWQPARNVTPSGLAIVYLHGGAFYLLDKDYGTRPLFRYLAAQGHVIMDVAYRLSPETDVMGMIHDVKRAICWMKENAVAYHIRADQIVVGGGSAGGHLALLTAYTSTDARFTLKEFEGKDTRVCGVLSFYGSNDMEAIYYHTNQHLTTRSTPGRPKKSVPTKMPEWIAHWMGTDYHRLGFDKGFQNAGALPPLLGGHPDECPEIYSLYSAITHVHPDCPPTYLIHGEHDIMAPVSSTRALFARLINANVPTVMHILPQTDHAFDLILPGISPPAHTEFYDVERFLALQVRSVQPATLSKESEAHELTQ